MNITKVGQFSGHQNSIYTISKSLKEGHFYSGASDGFVVEWNIEKPGDGVLLVNVLKPVYSLLLLEEQKILLIGTATGNIHVVDLETRKEIKNIVAHKNGVFDLKSIDHKIISVGEDGFIKTWTYPDLQLLHGIEASTKSARVIAYSDLRKEIAVGFSDFKIRIYDANTYLLKKVLDDHTNSVFALSYSMDSSLLVSGGRDAKLHIRDCANNFELINDIPAHTLHINCITYNSEVSIFATASMDKTIKIWDAKSNTLLKVIDKIKHEGHTSSVNKIIWINHNRILSCSDDRQIMLWECTGL